MASSLWDKAFNSLDADLRNGLAAPKTHKRDILRWKPSEQYLSAGNGSSKRPAEARHILEKTTGWIKTFQSVGDVAVSDVEVFGALASDCKS
ncbi:hypothetical protein PG993_012508 [Apiospora rasikravindrae]|uniref:Uncharacterized protein n=1 Tax=Apiospora rasikravindrae TaxID=990691 RepID=A0ABR1S3Z1_9PEZI